jgi:DMSO reductase family type II enzyme heme b subunit
MPSTKSRAPIAREEAFEMRKVIRHAFLMTACAVVIAGCRRPEAPSPVTHVVVATAASLPAEPGDDAWNQAPELLARLIPQDLVDPRLMEATTGDLRVRALSDGNDVAFRLQWTDGTRDDVAVPATFADACAIQLPQKIEPTLPAPQMGEEGGAVEITYWSAAWQAVVDGRGNSL